MKKNFNHLIIVGVLIVLLTNILISYSVTNILIKEKEKIQPSSVELITIKNDCVNCYNQTNFINDLKTQKVKILKEEKLNQNNSKAQELIKKYNLTQLPVTLIIGELEKIETYLTQNTQKIDERTYIKNPEIPYYSINESRTVGTVNLIFLKPSNCENCINIETFGDLLKTTFGVTINTVTNIPQNIMELQINYNITVLPAVIISKDIEYYPDVLNKVPLRKRGENYIYQHEIPLYFNLTSDKIEGIVELTLIQAIDCETCYNNSMNQETLETGFKIFFGNINEIYENTTQGKELIKKYNITKIPTYVLSPEINKYSQALQVLLNYGKIINGSYVFTDLDFITSKFSGTYKNITK